MTPCGMEKDAVLVTVADQRLACRGFLAKINESIVARICHDQSYADKGILIRDLKFCCTVA